MRARSIITKLIICLIVAYRDWPAAAATVELDSARTAQTKPQQLFLYVENKLFKTNCQNNFVGLFGAVGRSTEWAKLHSGTGVPGYALDSVKFLR